MPALLLWPAVCPGEVDLPSRLALSPSSRNKGVPHRMSSIVYDYLLPLLGPEQAAYWAQILVINPAG
ncbi:hypothetical protein GCM10027089_30740 [Nocardia thraciensis]